MTILAVLFVATFIALAFYLNRRLDLREERRLRAKSRRAPET